ncbi:MAG: hypothetical protein Q8J74_01755 [Candidatus Didemnitutus sp.]|nr:hypothetical protein [Candidatus Didemnitutus sp.]
MKTLRPFLLLAALSPAALLLTSCSKNDPAPTVVQKTQNAAKEMAVDVKSAAVDSWDSIKDYTYEKRADFAAMLDRLAVKHDTEIKAMNAKLEGLTDAAAKNRDLAAKEFKEARASLSADLAELNAATADTWDAAKKKVADSWQRTQAAFEKLKASASS